MILRLCFFGGVRFFRSFLWRVSGIEGERLVADAEQPRGLRLSYRLAVGCIPLLGAATPNTTLSPLPSPEEARRACGRAP